METRAATRTNVCNVLIIDSGAMGLRAAIAAHQAGVKPLVIEKCQRLHVPVRRVARLETVVDWKEPYHEDVFYYLRDGRVRGVLLWNGWEQVDAARKLIAEAGPFRAGDLLGRMPA